MTALMPELTGWDLALSSLSTEYVGAVALDANLAIQAVHGAVADRCGFTEAELLAMTALDMIHPDDVVRGAAAMVESTSIEGTRLPALYRLRLKDGGYEPFEVRATSLGVEDGALAIQIFEPNTEVRAEAFADELVRVMQLLVAPGPLGESLHRIADFAERYVEGLSLSITAFLPDGSSAAIDRTGVPESVLAANRAVHVLVPPPHVVAAVDAQLRPGADPYKPGITDDQISGRVTVAALDDDDDELLGYIEAFRVIDGPPARDEWIVYLAVQRLVSMMLQRRRLDEQLRYAADRDPLTGLLNRRRLLDDMGATQCLGGSGLLLIDLDDFSWVNNTLGHAAGDRAIVAASEYMLSTAPEEAMVARWGGDEFVIWVPGPLDAAELDHLAEALRAAMRVPVTVSDSRELLRCSIGATVMEPGESPEDAINRADKAMYGAKRAGGDRVRSVS